MTSFARCETGDEPPSSSIEGVGRKFHLKRKGAHMAKLADLAGMRFERLLALEQSVSDARNRKWICLCDCGKKCVVTSYHLRSHKVKSCGCYRVDFSREKAKTHGMCYTRFYRIYASILTRVTNTNEPSYPRYGGRGIKICERWLSFDNFYEDMFPSYSKDLEIDRIDNDGDYEPSNCRWVTKKTNCNNRSTNRYETLFGETKTAAQWCEHFGIKFSTVFMRIRYGWSVEDAYSRPIRWSRYVRKT